jgi:hypothetical protein
MLLTKYKELIKNKYGKIMFYLLGMLIAVLFFISSPNIYAFGIDNQDEQLPPIKHLMQQDYLSGDWATIQNSTLDSPRFYYNVLLSGLSSLFGLWNAFFVLWLISFVTTVIFLFKITERLFINNLTPFLIVIFFLIPLNIPSNIIYFGSLQPALISFGGNTLFANNLIPATIVNALVLVAFYFILKNKYLLSFIILAVATILEIPIGFGAAAAVTFFVFFERSSKGDFSSPATLVKYLKKLPLSSFILYGAIVFLGFLKVVINNFSAAGGMDALKIMAWVRHPHHYILSTWSRFSILSYLLIVGLFIFIYVLIKIGHIKIFKDRKAELFSILIAGAMLFFMFFGGYVFTEILPIGLIIKLQPFHIAYLPLVFMLGALFSFVLYLAERLVSKLTKNNAGSFLMVKIVMAAMIILFFLVHTAEIARKDYSFVHLNFYQGYDFEKLDSVYAWIRQNTPETAQFIAPPYISSFRLGAERAIIVDGKTFVFKPDAMLEWYSKINLLCGRTEAEIKNFEKYDAEQCRMGFNDLSEESIEKISNEYSASWLLTENPNYHLAKKYSDGKFYVYKIK